MIEEIVGVGTAHPMLLRTTGSVGSAGKNSVDDVRLVQFLLNNVPPTQGGPSRPLVVDGRCGPLTIAAIHRFQQTKFGRSDGVVEARNRTIRWLVMSSIAAGKPVPSGPAIRPATAEEAHSVRGVLNFPFDQLRVPIGTSNLAIGQAASNGATMSPITGSNPSSGFGAPFTPSGWTIDNSVGAFDVTIKDTGVYVAMMEIFLDRDPSVRQKLKIGGVVKGVSLKDGPPFGADFSLPSFAATKGKIIRGLNSFAPIAAASFFGICGIFLAGANAPVSAPNLQNGVGATLIQFQWPPLTPPGLCLGFAVMLGVQIGIPGASAVAGTGICVPI